MPNISIPRFNELVRAETRLKELHEEQAIQPVVEKLTGLVMMLLAHNPYETWPDLAKTALREVERDMPSGVSLYKARLPK